MLFKPLYPYWFSAYLVLSIIDGEMVKFLTIAMDFFCVFCFLAVLFLLYFEALYKVHNKMIRYQNWRDAVKYMVRGKSMALKPHAWNETEYQ